MLLRRPTVAHCTDHIDFPKSTASETKRLFASINSDIETLCELNKLESVTTGLLTVTKNLHFRINANKLQLHNLLKK